MTKIFRNISGDEAHPLWIPTNVGRYALSLESDKWINLDDRFGQAPNYEEYVALLSQTGTNAPTAIVLNEDANNYLGDIVWTYDSPGYYIGTLTDIGEDIDKLFFQISPTNLKVVTGGIGDPVEIYVYTPVLQSDGTDTIVLNVIDPNAKTYANGGLSNSTVVIRKYN